jgi:tetratricopeptide (TPR) repeat protein
MAKINGSRGTNDDGRTCKRVAKVTGPLGLSPRSSIGGLVLFASLIVIAGCGSPAQFLSARDSEIKDSTNAIETARDDRQRAKAYSSRGTAYSEKARYSRMSKLIPNDEYKRLFGLAMEDHNRAVTLDPNNAEVYFNRAQTNYDRGTLDLVENKEPLLVNPTTKSWLDAAASDFEKAAEIDPKNSLTLDRLGLTYEQADEEDKAVRAYTQEWALDRLGKQRLADAYCFFGFRHQQQKELAAAAAAYQKSIEFGVADDKSCPYDALGNGIEIYTIETREYDKAWEMVHQAQKANRLIAPELIERLKKDSKRTR